MIIIEYYFLSRFNSTRISKVNGYFHDKDVDLKIGYNLEKDYDNSQQINWVID